MARLLMVTLGCISLYLQLPGALPRRLGRRPLPARPRELPARTPSSGLQPRHPASQPATWKLRQAPPPQRSAGLAPTTGRPRQGHSRRHSGPHRPQARLLRVGCVLGTCQVHSLSHRLWQFVGQASRLDLAPGDPGSPHSYG
ncbi:protein ADM2 [Dasypus novemcinctus]|uniref:protein ADM2 n=1 Tax=Dasypus novemcinctus TaxID=9361 RepID=UPI00032926B0|nr:protein ADM2 [Dasypus novemcinctus]